MVRDVRDVLANTHRALHSVCLLAGNPNHSIDFRPALSLLTPHHPRAEAAAIDATPAAAGDARVLD
jgi:hypothetical protein